MTNPINEIERLKKANHYKSAIEVSKDALARFPEHTIIIAYNLGAIYQTELGYGDIAKDYYLKAINWHTNNPDHLKNAKQARHELDVVLAATYENLTLLSDSYEEINKLANKLWAINPNEINLKPNIKLIQEKQRRGKSWPETYYEVSSIFWNVDPSKDRGLYGFGASIYRRLLVNRKKFRLSRQLYEFCAVGYGGLMQLILFRILNKMKGESSGRVHFDEIAFIVDDSIALLSEYLKFNPNDERVKKTIDILKETMQKYSGASKTSLKKGNNFNLIDYKKRIVGETRCQNQIVLNTNNQNELFEIIEKLSDILLIPFKKSLNPSEFNTETQKEFLLVQRFFRRGGKVSIYPNNIPAQNSFCLVGKDEITASAWVNNALGMEQTTIPNINKAFQYFSNALKESPDYSFAIYNIATCYAMKGELQEAVKYFEKAHKIYPADNEIYNELIQCKQELQHERISTVQYNQNKFPIGSPYYNENDDSPPRCRSCGSTNINFSIHGGERYWICTSCGRQSGEAATYDPVTAVPAPHNDPIFRKDLRLKPDNIYFICPDCGHPEFFEFLPGIISCKKCHKIGLKFLYKNRINPGNGCLLSSLYIILTISLIFVLIL
jgi:tetratricopeptide (TPR) repeat protein/ribosomal protein L37AE/L43A